MKVKLLEFAKHFVFLGEELISFADRPYLPEVYAAAEGNLILRCGRQVEKSTMLVNVIIYLSFMYSGIKILFCCPREEQADFFVSDRLMPAIQNSPFVRRVLIGSGKARLTGRKLEFANGSRVYVRSAFNSADAARGISADVLLIDEFQDAASGNLPVLMETLSHSTRKQIILTGTPKGVENHLDATFRHSTACEWLVPCGQCSEQVHLDENVMGPQCPVCSKCGNKLEIQNGLWVPRNPESTWGRGFCISHFLVPWVAYEELLAKQASYSAIQFRNECLGLPTVLGDRIVTREEVEACCIQRRMATKLEEVPREGQHQLVAGIDWGGGANSATVLVIGYMREEKEFQVCRFDRFHAKEDSQYVVSEVAKKCRAFRVCAIAADGGGNGHVLNRCLFDKLQFNDLVFSIFYASSESKPYLDGVLRKWAVDRSATLGLLFTRIKIKTIKFPNVSDCGSFLDEFLNEYQDYDRHNRTIQFRNPDQLLDDVVHATNYAQIVGAEIRNAVYGTRR